MEKIPGVEQELPVDLIFEILAKLPVKSLCRFRCVSKLWRSVIADPLFVKAHLACSAARPEFLILLSASKPTRGPYTCIDAVGMEVRSPDNPGLTQTCGILVSVQECSAGWGYISQQAGSLYCRCFPDFARVSNPSTRECLDIKTVKTNGESFYNIYHFGFDPVEKKHKVLNILLVECGKAIGSRVFILEDNCWRTTANPYPPCLRVRKSWNVICIDGIIFDVASIADSSARKMSAFHVRSETFEVISLPETASCDRLIEFMGLATLVHLGLSGSFQTVITLWILEGPRKQIWRRKTRRIPNYDLESLFLHGGTPAGELLFTGGKNLLETFFLLLYNVESNTARRIEVQGLPEDIPRQVRIVIPEKVYFHAESLKSPRGASSLTSVLNSPGPSHCWVCIGELWIPLQGE